ncbi:hypothetical protein PIB30_071437 [Stylosanthes scabra]|uniref:Uncharacterized protein n=1 Tax=Stylosanthes scabra TaxID=79078 RepID=A0ABU6UML6_9FABA|nr:hypothetical protein [Stylosanthes scabra]
MGALLLIYGAASEPIHISSHQHCRRHRSIASKSLVAVLKVEEVSAVVVSSRRSHPTSHPVAVDLAAAPSQRRRLGSVSIQHRRHRPPVTTTLASFSRLQAFVFDFHLRFQAAFKPSSQPSM